MIDALMKKVLPNFSAKSADLVSSFDNEIRTDPDGWAMIAPFGDFPGVAMFRNDQGQYERVHAIQRVDKEAAQDMVSRFKSPLQRLKRFVRGLPIFRGHPDSPGGLGDRFPDKACKGLISDLAVRGNGLYGKPVLNNEGLDLVESGQARAFSARWSSEWVAKIGGKDVFRPNELMSVGLTNHPNLPVEWLNESDQLNGVEISKVIAWLNILGAQLAEDATPDQVQEAMDRIEAIVSLPKELQAVKAETANLKVRLDCARQELGDVRGHLDDVRQSRINLLLDRAQSEGRIHVGQRGEWARRLAASFDNESRNLAFLPPSPASQPDWSNMAHRQDVVASLVQEEMARSKCSYNDAFGRVERANPGLFNAMQKPGTMKDQAKAQTFTNSSTARRSEGSNMAHRQNEVSRLVQEEMARSKCSYDDAFNRVQRANPGLFEAMLAPSPE